MDYKEQIKHPKWQKKRLEILSRDNFTCQDCFDNESQLNVHHISYLKGAKIWEYENDMLLTLCNNCHNEMTKLSIESNEIISSFVTPTRRKHINEILICLVEWYPDELLILKNKLKNVTHG